MEGGQTHGSERLVPLLSGRVPYLELDGRPVLELERLGQERGAYRALPICSPIPSRSSASTLAAHTSKSMGLTFLKVVLDESEAQRRLADRALAQQDDLKGPAVSRSPWRGLEPSGTHV